MVFLTLRHLSRYTKTVMEYRGENSFRSYSRALSHLSNLSSRSKEKNAQPRVQRTGLRPGATGAAKIRGSVRHPAVWTARPAADAIVGREEEGKMTLYVKDRKTGKVIGEYHYKDVTICGNTIVIGRGNDEAVVYPVSDVVVTANEDDHIYVLLPDGKRVKIR